MKYLKFSQRNEEEVLPVSITETSNQKSEGEEIPEVGNKVVRQTIKVYNTFYNIFTRRGREQA